VAVVRASDLGPFVQATSAFVATLERDVLQPEVLTFDLGGDEAHAEAVLRDLRAARPTVVVTVGSFATSVVLAAKDVAVPVVFSMVLYPAESGFLARRPAGVTGVALDVPPEVQLGTVRRLVPSARRVGVLYNPAETGRIVAAARTAAERAGLVLVAREVAESGAAVGGLEALAQEVDVVWSVADGTVFTSQTTSALILAALRRRLPLFGLSQSHVRAGALAATVVDYADVGRQTAEATLRVLRGTPASEIPVATPRRPGFVLNVRTAGHLGLQVAPDVVADAVEVVR
jgi:putative ABC transport system substrate-binding protein